MIQPQQLTRRRYPERADCWHIYCGDVRVGTIAAYNGNSAGQWQWLCGFYPGCHPGEQRIGTAATFDEARACFEDDWKIFSAKRTDADYQAWRDHRDWTAWKYQMHDLALPLPTQNTSGRSRCFCGAEITIASLDQHVRAAHRDIGA